MKRRIGIFVLLLFCVLSVSANATQITEIIPPEIAQQFSLDTDKVDDPASVLSSFSFSTFLSMLERGLKSVVPQLGEMLFEILSILIILVLVDRLFTSQNHRFAASCVGNAVLVLFLLRRFTSSIILAEENLETIRVFCQASIPIITAILIAGGKSFASTLFSYGISLSSTLISTLSHSICLPMIRIYLAFGCCSTVWNDINFGAICVLIKRIIKWLIGIVFSVFSLTFSMQTILSRSADGIAFKTLKAAAGGIPFLGNVFSGGLDGAFTLLSGAKTSASIIGIGVIIAVFIGPALTLVCQYFAISLSETIAVFLDAKECTLLLKATRGAYELILGLFLVCVMMSIICYLMICVGVG